MTEELNCHDSRLTRRECLNKLFYAATVATASLGAWGCQKRNIVICGDPARLTEAENSLRMSVHYAEKSPQHEQTCAGCAFFESSGRGIACGMCKLLKGPVNPSGHCDSWSAGHK